MRREWRGAVYQIQVRNPDHVSTGVAAVTIDRQAHDPVAPIPVQPAGAQVHVEVTLGQSAG